MLGRVTPLTFIGYLRQQRRQRRATGRLGTGITFSLAQRFLCIPPGFSQIALTKMALGNNKRAINRNKQII